MKYSSEEALQVIQSRGELLKEKRERRSVSELAGVSAVLFSVLVLMTAFFGQAKPGGPVNTVYGSTLLPSSAGGYVLVGVICFAAAVAVTVLCLKKKNNKNGKTND